MKLEEIVESLKRLTEEVEKLRDIPSKERKDGEKEKEWQRIAKRHTLSTHILRECEENVRKDYMAILFSIFGKEEREEVRKNRLLFLYRLLFSFDEEADISEYITKSMKVESEFLDKFLSIMNKETTFFFAVDLLILGMIGKDEEIGYKKVAAILGVLKLEREEIERAARIARGIVEQNIDECMKHIGEDDDYDYNCLIGYFDAINITGIVGNIEKAKKMKGSIVIANAKVTQLEDFIHLDEFEAEEITFRGCRFENIMGVRNLKKKVTFWNCLFKGTKNRIDENGEVVNKGTDKLGREPFIKGPNYTFIETKFTDCILTGGLLDLSNSDIINSEIVGCIGRFFKDKTYLVKLWQGTIVKSKFLNNTITGRSDFEVIFGFGQVCIIQGSIESCIIEKCVQKLENHTLTSSKRICSVFAGRSSIIDSVFNHNEIDIRECRMLAENCFMIGLNDSKEQNNQFKQCMLSAKSYGGGMGGFLGVSKPVQKPELKMIGYIK